MAITILKNLTSGYFYPSANPISVSVDSNNSGKCNFRYVCDIWINSNKTTTIKMFPDPTTGYGLFEISRILQDYVETLYRGTNYTHLLDPAQTVALPTAAFSFQLKFGEEYDLSTNCDGQILQYLNLATSNQAYVFESAVEFSDYPYFNSNNFVVGTNSTATFLTNSPRQIDITYNDGFYLDFLTKLTINATDWRVDIKTFNQSNIQTATYSYAAARTHTGIYRFRIACGPLDINSVANSTIINPQVKYYTVNLRHVPTGNIVTEVVTFNIKEPTTFRHRFGFVGQPAGHESFTFFHRLRKSIDIQKVTYNKPLDLTYGGSPQYNIGGRGTDIFSISATEKATITTFVKEDFSKYLTELYLSKNAWFLLRPELIPFRSINDGGVNKLVIYDFDNAVGLAKDTPINKLSVGDFIYVYGDDANYNGRFQITNKSGDILTTSATWSALSPTCGWIHKSTAWRALPIIVDINSVEIQQRLGRPIQYQLDFQFANTKILLK